MSKLIPFSIEAALNSEPVCLDDGVIITPDNVRNGNWQISIRIADASLALFYEPRYDTVGGTKWYNIDRLFMAPKQREVWVNLYSASAFVHGEFYGYKSEEQADRADVSGGKRLGNCAHKIIINE